MSATLDPVRLFCDSIALGMALAVVGVLAAQQRQRTERLIVFLALITALLMACRIFNQIWEWVGIDIAIEFIVSALPIAVLLLAESLIRRHAPRWMKLTALIGGTTILLLTLFRTEPISGLRIPLMGTVLITNFALVLWFLLTRDKTSLMRNENARITSLLVGFAFMIPLAAGDFWPLPPEESLGPGAIGALIGILVIVRGIKGRISVKGFLVDLLIVAVGSAALALSFGHLFSLEGYQTRSLAACAAALILAVLIVGQLRHQFLEAGVAPLSLYIARARLGSLDLFLKDLRGHHLIDGARLLEGDELKRIAAPEVIGFMERNPVASKAVLERTGEGSEKLERGAVLSLLTEAQMTHIVSLGLSPPRLLLVESPGFGDNAGQESDLVLLSRLAHQIEKGRSDG